MYRKMARQLALIDVKPLNFDVFRRKVMYGLVENRNDFVMHLLSVLNNFIFLYWIYSITFFLFHVFCFAVFASDTPGR